jgi:hypothetical protein
MAVSVMEKRGQGNRWQVEGKPRELVGFDYCFQVVEIPRIAELEVFVKQNKHRARVMDT